MKKEKSFFADTSFLIDLIRDRKEATEIAEDFSDVLTSTLCMFELGKKVDFDATSISEKKFLPPDIEDAREGFRIYRELSERGDRINTMDFLIAAQAINSNRVLLTADEDFKKIKDLETRYYRE